MSIPSISSSAVVAAQSPKQANAQSMTDTWAKGEGEKPLFLMESLLRGRTQSGPLPQAVASAPKLLQFQNEAETCHEQAPSSSNAFVVRKYREKFIRDVCVDTHDLINEPGGFIMNFSLCGSPAESRELRVHLGLRQKCNSSGGNNMAVVPGTITLTDDYSREIFRGLKLLPKMKTLVAVLEINPKEDPYELKRFQDPNPEFLRQIVQPIPTTITTFHIEIPGISGVYLPEWKFLLDQQSTLQVLICNFGVVMWKFYEKCIANNAKTLSRIILRRLQTYDIAKGSFTPMDWRMFSSCQKLTYLKVTCGYRSSQSQYLTAPPPPPTVAFLHENMEKLPQCLLELHLGQIWVEPCLLQSFQSARPTLNLCSNCNDMEYYDGDKPRTHEGNNDHRVRNIGLVSVSRVDILAEVRGEKPSPNEKQFLSIILAMFLVVLIALVVLFVIIYFGHWRRRGGHQKYENITQISDSEQSELTTR